MYVVLCENTDEAPGIYGPFDSAEIANLWISSRRQSNCPNEHFVHAVVAVDTEFDIAETVAQ